MDRFRKFLDIATGDVLWAVILIPILAISWVGFYTIARAVGVPPLFAAGMSAAFDGVALFAARIGLKHRRKGFSGYLARFTVIAFVALGAFVQSFHGRATPWIHAHSWIVWATAPVAACLAYELHLGWTNRKRLVRMGYSHPSAKAGFGPATWFLLKTFGKDGTLDEYKRVLRARRDFIAEANMRRFRVEEAMQPQLVLEPIPGAEPAKTESAETHHPDPETTIERPVAPKRHPASRALHSVPAGSKKPATKAPTKAPKRSRVTANMEIAAWCEANGYPLGYNRRVPIEGLRAYRAAHPASGRVKSTAA